MSLFRTSTNHKPQPARAGRHGLVALLLTAFVAALLTAAPGQSLAKAKRRGAKKKKPKPACGLTYLPMAVGNTWTYEPMESPITQSDEDIAAIAKMKMSVPPPPEKFVIKVLAVKKTGATTTVTLEEKADAIVHKTTLVCTEKSLQVDPQSFFFAAEPGGAIFMELSDLKRTGPTLPGAKGFKPGVFKTLLRAKVSRQASPSTEAKLTDGTVELERSYFPSNIEQVSTPTGLHKRAQRVEFDLVGRVSVVPTLNKTFEIPMVGRSIMWFQPGVGVVQARSRVGQWFQLTETNTL